MAAKPKAVKKVVKRKAEPPKPKHPLMTNGQSWDKQKVMDILCMKIAASSKSIVTLLAEGHGGNTLPTYTAIKEWLAADEVLAAQYARAKEDQAEYLSEELLDIVDADPSIMPMTGALDGASVQHARLRADTRKWLMSKLKPKKYGDKVALDHSGNIGLESIIAGAGEA